MSLNLIMSILLFAHYLSRWICKYYFNLLIFICN